jgi:exopolyphosphatase/guanosine-5'-triphosphate,3'-diphosphate pyrophosphatase
MLVADRTDEGDFRVLADRTEITRLGERSQATGAIQEEAIERTLSVIGRFLEEAHSLGVRRFAAVGTMCLRTARNAGVFLERVRQEYHLTIEVISGEDEAHLSYLAVQQGLAGLTGRVVVFDIGGGSTEFIVGQGGKVERRSSLDLGAIRLTEQFLPSDPVPVEELKSLQVEIKRALTSHLSKTPWGSGPLHPIQNLVGVGGTPTNLSAVKIGLARYDPLIIRGSCLTIEEVEELMEMFRSKTISERRTIVGLEPKRAEVILAGTAMVLAVMQHYNFQEVKVSDQGVRHGLMIQRFGG